MTSRREPGAVLAAQPSRPKKRSRRDSSGDFEGVRRAIQAMETTFITIHDLTPDANILYASQSIRDVLDYEPEDVVSRCCWNFFHPDEVSFARTIHDRGVELDKASVLNYCRIKNKHGLWIGCECVFTIVYNVLIGCTSVYLDGPKAKKRAVVAPVVRQLFSSSPKDPRYRMLTHISSKFTQDPDPHLHEPRAAFFLNRFTRALTINFATNGLESLLGITADEIQGKSFYYCIQENCLSEAVRCLESAKENDSIAYLRFWYRDPRSDDVRRHEELLYISPESESDDKEESDGDILLSKKGSRDPEEVDDDDDEDDDDDDDEDGGVSIVPDAPEIQLDSKDIEDPETARRRRQLTKNSKQSRNFSSTSELGESSRQSSTNNTESGRDALGQLFDHNSSHRSSTPRTNVSVDSPASESSRQNRGSRGRIRDIRRAAQVLNEPRQIQSRPVELEAVISCTSDGLVVVLRAARPFLPSSVRVPPQPPVYSPYSNGLFASPWATNPVMPSAPGPTSPGEWLSGPSTVTRRPPASTTSISTRPRSAFASSEQTEGLTANLSSQDGVPGGPPMHEFMESIRDVAVFAWALTGINGSLQEYGRGKPLVGAVPQTGLPVWDPDGSLAREEANRDPGRTTQGPGGGAGSAPGVQGGTGQA